MVLADEPLMRCARLRRSATCGFTLIELMVIVALIGVLSVVAIAGYRYWIKAARTGETKDLIQTIMLGQHTYFAEHEGYLSCSASWLDYYPMAPTNTKHLFHDPAHSGYECWILLAPDVMAPTYAAFTVRAGNSGESPPQPPTQQQLNWPAPDKPWYIVVATVNQDGDNELGHWVGSSFQPGSIHGENETE